MCCFWDGRWRFSNIQPTALLILCKQNATEVLNELLVLDFQLKSILVKILIKIDSLWIDISLTTYRYTSPSVTTVEKCQVKL